MSELEIAARASAGRSDDVAVADATLRATTRSRCCGGCSRWQTSWRSPRQQSLVGLWGSGTDRRAAARALRADLDRHGQARRPLRPRPSDAPPPDGRRAAVARWCGRSAARRFSPCCSPRSRRSTRARATGCWSGARCWGSGSCSARLLRGLWRRITPPQRVLIVGDGPLAQAVVRKLELFPDIHAEIRSRIPSCAELHARLDEVIEDVDRVVIACSELNEALLEELLPVCRASRRASSRSSRRRAACSARPRI